MDAGHTPSDSEQLTRKSIWQLRGLLGWTMDEEKSDGEFSAGKVAKMGPAYLPNALAKDGNRE